MGLKDIQIPTADVVVGSGSFAVRGLSTSDIEALVRLHGSDLRSIFKEFVTGELSSTQLSDMTPVLREVAARVPAAIVDVIYLAADGKDDEDRESIRRFSTGIQIDALGKIAALTLSTEGDMGKALETVIKVLGSVNEGAAQALLKAAS